MPPALPPHWDTDMLSCPAHSGFLVSSFIWVFCLHVCLCTVDVPSACRGHQTSWNCTHRGCELPCRYWERNPDSLEEQPELLITEPSLQPHLTTLKKENTCIHKHTYLYIIYTERAICIYGLWICGFKQPWEKHACREHRLSGIIPYKWRHCTALTVGYLNGRKGCPQASCMQDL